METTATTTTTAPATTAARSFADQTLGEKTFTLLVFGAATAANIAFAYYLFSDPTKLTELWQWTRSQNLLVQGTIWLLCLPWMIALLIWNMPWAFAVRLVLVLAMLVFTEYLIWPFK